jgi:hypothetical protein
MEDLTVARWAAKTLSTVNQYTCVTKRCPHSSDRMNRAFQGPSYTPLRTPSNSNTMHALFFIY